MREGKPGHDISSLSQAEREKAAEREIAMLAEAKKTPKKQRFAEGTAPDARAANEELQRAKSVLEDDFSDKEVTQVKDRSLNQDIAGIMEGLDKAGVMAKAEQEEENEWKDKISTAKQKIVDLRAAEESEWGDKISAAKQKIAAADKRAGLRGKVKAGAEARQKAVETMSQRTIEAKAEESAKWENKEWDAKLKAAEDKEEVKSVLTRLKERLLGLGKKKEQK